MRHPMDEQPDFAVLAVGPFGRLRELQRALAGGGFDADIVDPAGGSSGGG